MSTTMIALGVAVRLSGMSEAARQLDGLRGKLKGFSDAAGNLGRTSLGGGLIAAGTMMKSVSAFAALEDASTRLKVTMMDRNGLTGAFDQVNALAVKLGDQLPGTSVRNGTGWPPAIATRWLHARGTTWMRLYPPPPVAIHRPPQWRSARSEISRAF